MFLTLSQFVGCICGAICSASIITALVTWLVMRLFQKRSKKIVHLNSPPVQHRDLNSCVHEDFWRPQPAGFQQDEYELLTHTTASYIFEKAEDLCTMIYRLAHGVHWKDTPAAQLCDFTSILTDARYPIPPQESFSSAAQKLHSRKHRKQILASLIFLLLIQNTMPGGSPEWSLVSPELSGILSDMQTIGNSGLSPFLLFGLEKARVYLFHSIYPIPGSFALTGQHMAPKVESQKAAISKLRKLIEVIFAPYLELSHDDLILLDRCLNTAQDVGLAIQRSLRPWNWSFEHGGPRDTSCLARISESIQWVEAPGSFVQSRTVPEEHRINQKKRTVIFPALVTEGDESGRRYTAPRVVLEATLENV